MKMQDTLKSKCGVTPKCFAYPFGSFSQKTHKMLREMGFKMLFTCTEKPNIITHGKSETVTEINRYNRSGNVSCKSFFDKIEKDVRKLQSE